MCATAQSSSALVRNFSFSPLISTRNSLDFEFDFSNVDINDELPVSPKLNTFSYRAAIISNNYNDEHINVLQQEQLVEAQYDSDHGIKHLQRGVIHPSKQNYSSDDDEHDEKRRVNLGSLMSKRRELDQLPPLQQYEENRKDVQYAMQIESIMCGSPSTSSCASSSSSSSRSNSTSSSASPQFENQKIKSSRKSWPFKLDFLKKTLLIISPNAAHDDHHIRPQLINGDLCSSNSHVHHASHADNTSSSRIIESFADVGSLQNDDYHHKEAESINYAKFESPTRSKRDKYLHTNAGGGPARPMSPHAQHYEQQRARAEELRRRTFLPYRHSLLGA